MITKETLADRLHGVDVGEEDANKQIITDAKANGLLIVFGASDDLCEFRGAFDDECSPDDKGRMPFLRSGKAFDPDAVSTALETLADELGISVPMPETLDITAHWCKPAPDGRTPSWHYRTSLPHATFDVFDDGELYCIGMVIDLKEDGAQLQDAGAGTTHKDQGLKESADTGLMDAKHTPGPLGIVKWQSADLHSSIEGVTVPALILSIDGRSILHAVALSHVAEPVSAEDRKMIGNALAEYLANARLIAAAPDLLAALKYMKEVGCEFYDMDMGENGCAALEQANAAIAKAEEGAGA